MNIEKITNKINALVRKKIYSKNKRTINNLLNEEVFWLDDVNDNLISFVCNSYNYERIHKTKKSIKHFMEQILKIVLRIDRQKENFMIFVGNLCLEYTNSGYSWNKKIEIEFYECWNLNY